MTQNKPLTEAEKWAKLPWQIKMADEAYQKFWRYVEICDGEVGAFGYATISEHTKEVVVDTIFLFPQESDASQVDFVETGLPYALERAAQDDRLDDLRFCIHSHGNHGAFWSSTDDDMIKKMGLTASWFASVIFNKKRDSVGRIDTFTDTPFGKCHWVVGNKLEVVSDARIEADAEAMAEVEQFVKKPVRQVNTYTNVGPASKGTGSSSTYTREEAEFGKPNKHSDVCVCGTCKGWRGGPEGKKFAAKQQAAKQQESPPTPSGEDTAGGYDQLAWVDVTEGTGEWWMWEELTDEVLSYEQAHNMLTSHKLAKVVATTGHHYFYGDQGRTFLAFEPDDRNQLVMQPGISRVAINAWDIALDNDPMEVAIVDGTVEDDQHNHNDPAVTAGEVTS